MAVLFPIFLSRLAMSGRIMCELLLQKEVLVSDIPPGH
jgi:hypothetical protein